VLLVSGSLFNVNCPLYPHCPPRQKISPPRKMWWKTSKKKRNFLLWNFLSSRRRRHVYQAASRDDDRSEGWQPLALQSSRLPFPVFTFASAWTQEWTHNNYHDSFCLFLFPIKEPNYTHTYKHIKIIIIDSTLTARWSNEWSTFKLCVSQALFAMKKNAPSLISFLQTRKLMIITTWRNLL